MGGGGLGMMGVKGVWQSRVIEGPGLIGVQGGRVKGLVGSRGGGSLGWLGLGVLVV